MVWAATGSQELKQASWINETWRARSEARNSEEIKMDSEGGKRK
jgi:hypothetical protein